MLSDFLNRLARWRRYRHISRKDPLRAMMWTVVPRCFPCHAEPNNHYFAQIASMPCNDATSSLVKELFYHVRNHDWERLRTFAEFRADQDDAMAYAIKGPHPGGMVVLIRDPEDLYSKVEIYLEESVTADELKVLETLVSEEGWRKF